MAAKTESTKGRVIGVRFPGTLIDRIEAWQAVVKKRRGVEVGQSDAIRSLVEAGLEKLEKRA